MKHNKQFVVNVSFVVNADEASNGDDYVFSKEYTRTDYEDFLRHVITRGRISFEIDGVSHSIDELDVRYVKEMSRYLRMNK